MGTVEATKPFIDPFRMFQDLVLEVRNRGNFGKSNKTSRINWIFGRLNIGTLWPKTRLWFLLNLVVFVVTQAVFTDYSGEASSASIMASRHGRKKTREGWGIAKERAWVFGWVFNSCWNGRMQRGQSQFLVGAFSKGQGLPCLGPIVSSHKLWEKPTAPDMQNLTYFH